MLGAKVQSLLRSSIYWENGSRREEARHVLPVNPGIGAGLEARQL